MTGPHKPQWFDWRMSIGNLISIIILVFGMAASWYALKQEQALQKQSLDMLQTSVTGNTIRIEKVELARDDMRERLIRLEVGQSQQNQMLREVLDVVKSRER
jgi:uncharacterized coiled-coil protein SlyX